MTLNDYYLKFGTAGLQRLADKAGTKLSYMKQLIYDPDKQPSMNMAKKLIEASGNELTYSELANPVKKLPKDVKREKRLGV